MEAPNNAITPDTNGSARITTHTLSLTETGAACVCMCCWTVHTVLCIAPYIPLLPVYAVVPSIIHIPVASLLQVGLSTETSGPLLFCPLCSMNSAWIMDELLYISTKRSN